MMATEIPEVKLSQGYVDHPGYDVHFEPSPKWLRVMFGGETIADSTEAKLLFESHHIPVYYFPLSDVRMDLMERTDHASHCPFKGDASYWTINAGGRSAENAMWGYEDPLPEVPELAGHVAFYWNKVDKWMEEDEEIFIHARDPYKRIDVIPSTRRIDVVAGGETVASSSRAMFLFETGLPTRYYLPADDVRMDLLSPTDHQTACPYKGRASYHSLEVKGETFDNIVWYYTNPLPEVGRIKDLICFFNEKVDAVLVDSEPEEKVKTPWS